MVESLFALIPTEWSLTWTLDWRQTLDIALMTFLIYQAYIRLRRTRAARVGVGLAVLGLSYFLALAAGLFLTSWVLGGIWAATFILVIVIFQTEIRQILEQIQPVIPSFLRRSRRAVETPGFLVTIADTCFALAKKRCGALLVFERHIPLEPLLRSQGVIVDAHISAELLENVFTPPTPLHDGALYIRDDRVYRASCILPLSETRSLPHFYGTRHRAAVGVTEHCDAMAIVVSEERGTVSVVERGGMVTMPGVQELLAWLTGRLVGTQKTRSLKWPGHGLITHNWQAKLGSLATVGMLWLILVGPQNTEVGFTVPVIYHNIPENLDLDGKRTQEVYVRVRGSRELLSLLDPRRLRAQIDLKEARAGRNRYSLSMEDINVPLGVQIAGVEPAAMTVRLKKKPPPAPPIAKSGATVTVSPSEAKSSTP